MKTKQELIEVFKSIMVLPRMVAIDMATKSAVEKFTKECNEITTKIEALNDGRLNELYAMVVAFSLTLSDKDYTGNPIINLVHFVSTQLEELETAPGMFALHYEMCNHMIERWGKFKELDEDEDEDKDEDTIKVTKKGNATVVEVNRDKASKEDIADVIADVIMEGIKESAKDDCTDCENKDCPCNGCIEKDCNRKGNVETNKDCEDKITSKEEKDLETRISNLEKKLGKK